MTQSKREKKKCNPIDEKVSFDDYVSRKSDPLLLLLV
jgi:hypothetical protein